MIRFGLFAFLLISAATGLVASPDIPTPAYPIASADYPVPLGGMWDTIVERAKFSHFNIFATLIFICAITHTFFFGKFLDLSKKLKKSANKKTKYTNRKIFLSKLFHILGEVEAIFALWLIPLFIGYTYAFGWKNLTAYIDKLTFVDAKYIEPVFVVVIMCIAATRPIIQASSDTINLFAKLGKGKVWAWWISILAVGPLLGSIITEPAAITICATLLAEKFYENEPSAKFKYATLGFLLAAISVGGTFTHFSAPPVLMVASAWDWSTPFMLTNFGWKAVIGIGLSLIAYFIIFRKEFANMQKNAVARESAEKKIDRVPFVIVAVHIGFLVFTVLTLHHPTLFIFAFLLFLAFVESTHAHQDKIDIKTPLLVGLFLAALVTHGSLQAWWIEPLLNHLGEGEVFLGTIVLSAFNDNAAITYLATLTPDFSPRMQYLVVAAAVASGGLTVIANAPNPAGVSILKKYFGDRVSPFGLLLGAILPTIIMASILYLL